jgi:hypothetical protein
MPVAALPVARRSRAALSGTEDQHVIAEMFDHSATRWLSRPQVRLLFLEGILTMTHGSCGPHANRMGREAVTQRNTHENQSVNSLTNKQGQRSPVTSRSGSRSSAAGVGQRGSTLRPQLGRRLVQNASGLGPLRHLMGGFVEAACRVTTRRRGAAAQLVTLNGRVAAQCGCNG